MTPTLLNVTDVTRIASAAAREQSPDLEVTGVTFGAGGGDYAEVLLNVRGCRQEPCRMSLGVFRNMSEPQLHAEIADKLRRHVEEHRPL